MAAKFTRLAHKISTQLYLVAESCNIYSSRCRRPVRKLLDIPSYSVTEKTGHRFWLFENEFMKWMFGP